MKEIITILVSAAFGTIGFSLLFRIDPKRLPAAALCGLISCGVLVLLTHLGCGNFISNLAAAGMSALFSEICGRKLHAPAVIFMIPSLIPLVPGRNLYYAMRFLISGDYAQFFSNTVILLQVGLGISGGIIAGSLISGFVFKRDSVFADKSK